MMMLFGRCAAVVWWELRELSAMQPDSNGSSRLDCLAHIVIVWGWVGCISKRERPCIRPTARSGLWSVRPKSL